MSAIEALPRLLAGSAAVLCIALAGAEGVPQAADAVAARFPEPATVYDTPGLQPGRDRFTGNEELRQALHELAARPQGPRLLAAGRSADGTAIEALHFSRGPGRPTVLLVGQQHGDEPAGAEALLAVARLLATPAWAVLLDRIDVVVLPRANPDGAALGLRWGRHGVDINRDHLRLSSPEARAIGLLVRAYRPLVVADLHEYPVGGSYRERFNALPRHDLLLQYATAANLPAELSAAAEVGFRQPLLRVLVREGLSADWFHAPVETPGERRLAMGGPQPDTLRNVQGLGQAVSFLLESRGLGLGRTHLQRRVHGHVVAVQSLLHSAAEQAAALQALRLRLDTQVAGQACRGDMVVLAVPTPTRRDMLMLDPVTGADKWVPVLWDNALELEPVIQRARPCGYWLAAEAGAAVHLLQELDVSVQRLDQAILLQAETWRETSRASMARPDARGGVDDGLGLRLVRVVADAAPLPVPAGGWWVPLDQPLAHLVVAALEPDTPGSWFAQRVLPTLASAARVMVVPDLASRAPAFEASAEAVAPVSPAASSAPAASAAPAAKATATPSASAASAGQAGAEALSPPRR
ncbi:MAG: peptidase M14 [Betaproteobacteria bacterium]|nr:peptidase M14 [Betaproteobacteria bacterium]